MTYKAAVYTRVSSSKQTEGDSPKEQVKRCQQYAKTFFGYELNELKVFQEQGSGKNKERPEFLKMLQFVQTPSIKQIFVYDIDRFTRSGVAHYENVKEILKNSGVELFDSKGIIQPRKNLLEGSGGKFGEDFDYSWSEYSPSESAEVMQAQQAREEHRKILARAIPIEIACAQKGQRVRPAYYGFKDTKIVGKDGTLEASQEPKEEEARFVRLMYEYAAQGMDVKVACEKLNKQGFKTRLRHKWEYRNGKRLRKGVSGGNPIYPELFWATIMRPGYAGFNYEKWTHLQPVQGNHAAIVSLDLWNKANEGRQCLIKDSASPAGWKLIKLSEKGKKKRIYLKDNPNYPYKGLLLCPKCNKPMLASASQGSTGQKFAYYHCGRGHKHLAINSKKFEEDLRNFLQNLRFTDEMAEILEVSIRTVWLQKLKDLNMGIMVDNERINELREESERVLSSISRVSNVVIIKKFEQRYEDLTNEISLIEQNRTKKEYTEQDVKKITNYMRKFIANIDELVMQTEDLTLLRNIWKLVFQENPTPEGIKNRTSVIAPILELKSKFNEEESAMVLPLRIELRF